ncbi:MAG: fructose-bisphosphatase class III [Isosphaeraceae bacterium]
MPRPPWPRARCSGRRIRPAARGTDRSTIEPGIRRRPDEREPRRPVRLGPPGPALTPAWTRSGSRSPLRDGLTLPKGTVHVISDVHGEYGKLRHVINNASGTLRPRIERALGGRLDPAELRQFLALVFYPVEFLESLAERLADADQRRAFARKVMPELLQLVREVARPDRLPAAIAAVPAPYNDLVRDLVQSPATEADAAFFEAMLDVLADEGRAGHLIHLIVRTLRNLAIDELILAGDLWDRGPRGDLVVDYLRKQPRVAITWGNHDMAWLGASLGHEPLIAQVLRISCRYRRLSQLEEGYGITVQPLEKLAREVYGDDPASCYQGRGTGMRDPLTISRMQKAAAILQFKLEGQAIARNPAWGIENRRLLHRIDRDAGTVTIDGRVTPLKDTHFPTIDPADPYRLSDDEQTCLDRMKQSFTQSVLLRSHMEYLVGLGGMDTIRDDHLIFHGCVPVDERGEFLPLAVGGQDYAGKALFTAIDRAVAAAFEHPESGELDLLWYLWCGPRSPLFGKDRVATFENDLVADPSFHVEVKNPYFTLIHEKGFCRRILAEFGADPDRGLIVNGHVPVKIDKGEDPLKRSGMAITIDGAFSEAYGDHGYTLVLEPDRTFLAQHSHFDSVEAAIRDGVDIIPQIRTIREWHPPRRVADTERGRLVRSEIALLERLAQAYRDRELRPTSPPIDLV